MRSPAWGLCLLAMCLSIGTARAEGHPVATVNEAGDFLDFRHDGRTMKDYLPVHRVAGARYFSAGVGLEERGAEYPPFPLKMIFTAGGKPFLSGVAVTIESSKGGAPLAIPAEHVEGPWLFVDLAPGLYDIAARAGDQQQEIKGIKVESGKQRVLYVRWHREHGVMGRLPIE